MKMVSLLILLNNTYSQLRYFTETTLYFTVRTYQNHTKLSPETWDKPFNSSFSSYLGFKKASIPRSWTGINTDQKIRSDTASDKIAHWKDKSYVAHPCSRLLTLILNQAYAYQSSCIRMGNQLQVAETAFFVFKCLNIMVQKSQDKLKTHF